MANENESSGDDSDPESDQKTKTICYHCNKSVGKKIYNCSKCAMPYHPSCAKQSGILPNDAVRKCCDFQYAIKQIWKNTIIPAINNKIDEKMNDAKEELCKKIEDKFESEKFLVCENLLVEMNQREIRAKNLLIHNIKEADSKSDKNIIKRFLHHIPIDVSQVKIQRIGKKDKNKTRMIKVIMQDKQTVIDILKDYENLKEHLPPDSFLTQDRTPAQINYRKLIIAEFDERKKNGEKDIQIKYIRNIPTIIKTNNVEESKNVETGVSQAQDTPSQP